MKDRVLDVTAVKIVIRNAWAEMVHVMESDASGDPPQDPGKAEVRAARNCGVGVVPALVVLPIGTLELVLHDKKPETRRDGDVVRWQIHQENARSEQRYEHGAAYDDGRVRRPDARDLS